jgi:hypothetical protein
MSPVTQSAGEASYAPPPAKAASAPVDCESARIEKAANGGFSVSVTPKRKTSTDPKEPVPYEEPQTHVFTTFEEVVPFLASCFQSAPAEPASDVETERPAPMPAPPQA